MSICLSVCLFFLAGGNIFSHFIIRRKNRTRKKKIGEILTQAFDGKLPEQLENSKGDSDDDDDNDNDGQEEESTTTDDTDNGTGVGRLLDKRGY